MRTEQITLIGGSSNGSPTARSSGQTYEYSPAACRSQYGHDRPASAGVVISNRAASASPASTRSTPASANVTTGSTSTSSGGHDSSASSRVDSRIDPPGVTA